MRLVRSLLFVAIFLLGNHLMAQDIHFTLYNMSPLTLNPANTGAYEGSIRLGGIYRDQWAKVFGGGNQYSTPSFFADAPVITGFRKQDWVGVGLMFYQDQAGIGDLKRGAYLLSASYHLGLDKKGQNVLTLGLQGGYHQTQFDITNNADIILSDESALGGNLGLFASEDRGGGQNGLESNYFDLNAGLLFTSKVSKTTSFNVGFAMMHLLRPEYNLLSAGSEDSRKLPLRFNVHTKLHTEFGENLMFEPTAAYQRIGTASQFILQGWGGYYLSPEKDMALKFGVGYRGAVDAAQVLLGFDYQTLRVALSYDVNVSELRDASRYRGGFEIAANYIFKIYKDPDVKPVIFCPQL